MPRTKGSKNKNGYKISAKVLEKRSKGGKSTQSKIKRLLEKAKQDADAEDVIWSDSEPEEPSETESEVEDDSEPESPVEEEQKANPKSKAKKKRLKAQPICSPKYSKPNKAEIDYEKLSEMISSRLFEGKSRLKPKPEPNPPKSKPVNEPKNKYENEIQRLKFD